MMFALLSVGRFVVHGMGRLFLASDVMTAMTTAEMPELPTQAAEVALAAHPKYHNYLISLMSYTFGREYQRGQQFNPDVFRVLTPRHIVRWMHEKAFGKPDPDYLADKPSNCRANTIEFMKKAVSYYMPDAHQWTEATTPPSGNPTKAKLIHKLLAVVRKAEVQGQGAKPQARRELSIAEFRKAIEILRTEVSFFSRWKYPTQLAMQFSLVGRGDDLMHINILDLMLHPIYNFALKTSVKWSKNVGDERACPPQILLGAMDTDFCVLLMVGVYLECWIQMGHANTSPFLFSANGDIEKGPAAAGKDYRTKLKKTYQHSDFLALAILIGGLLGIHSIRKCSVTFGKAVGRSADDLDVRGRWKRLGGRMIGRYIAVDQPIIDTITCQSLCPGGAIAYKIHPDAHGVSDTWLAENICPEIHAYFQTNGKPSIAHVLAKAVLWGCCDSNIQKIIPPFLVSRVKEEYDKISTLPEGVNPIIRQPVFFFRNDDMLEMHELDTPVAPATAAAAAAAAAATAAEQAGNNNNNATAAQNGTREAMGAQGALQRVQALQGVANMNRLQQGMVDRMMVAIRQLKQQITQSELAMDTKIQQIQLVILQEIQKMNRNVCR